MSRREGGTVAAVARRGGAIPARCKAYRRRPDRFFFLRGDAGGGPLRFGFGLAVWAEPPPLALPPRAPLPPPPLPPAPFPPPPPAGPRPRAAPPPRPPPAGRAAQRLL